MNLRQMRVAILAALCATTIASSAQQKQDTTPAASGAITNNPSPEVEHRQQIERFANFSQLLWNQEGTAQRHAQEGKPNAKDKLNYSKSVHITQSEEQVMWIILGDAAKAEFEQNEAWVRTGPGAHGAEMSRPERAAALEAKVADRNKIYEDALARLQQQFSKEDFKALDDYLYDTDTRWVLVGERQRAARAAVAPNTPAQAPMVPK